MFKPEDIKTVLLHLTYKKDCDGHLHCKCMRICNDQSYDNTFKYVWKCDKCGEEVLLDFSDHKIIIY